jgi:hypothetical protein
VGSGQVPKHDLIAGHRALIQQLAAQHLLTGDGHDVGLHVGVRKVGFVHQSVLGGLVGDRGTVRIFGMFRLLVPSGRASFTTALANGRPHGRTGCTGPLNMPVGRPHLPLPSVVLIARYSGVRRARRLRLVRGGRKCKLPAEIPTVSEIRKNSVRKATRCDKFTIAQPGS